MAAGAPPIDLKVQITGADIADAALASLVEKARAKLQDLNNATNKAAEGAQGLGAAFSSAMDKIGGTASATFDGLLSKAGAVGDVLGKIGPAGIAAAAGVGFLVEKLSGLSRYAEIEQAQLKLNAVISATGMASGVTAKQVNDLVGSIAATTFATKGDLRAAAAELLTFGNVAGDQFGRVLKLAADYTAVFGGDMASATTKLAKVMEDPEAGVQRLAKANIVLSSSTKEYIKDLAAQGDLVGAQNALLAEMEKRFGGAAEAEHSGLAGAMDNATKAQKAFNLALNESKTLANLANAGLEIYAATLKGMAGALGQGSLEQQLATLQKSAGSFIGPTMQADYQRRLSALTGAIIDRNTAEGDEQQKAYFGAKSNSDAQAADRAKARQATMDELNKSLERRLELARMGTDQAARQQAADAAELEYRGKVKVANDSEIAAIRDKAEAVVVATQARRDQEKAEADYQRRVEEAVKVSINEDKAQNDAIAAVGQQIDKLKAETTAIDENTRARAQMAAQLQAEKTLRNAVVTDNGQALTGRDLVAEARDAAGAKYDAEQAQKAKEQAARHAQAIADQQLRIANHTTDQIVDYAANGFDTIGDKGKGTWSSIAETALTTMRKLFSQLVAEALVRPIVQPIVMQVAGSGVLGLFGGGRGSNLARDASGTAPDGSSYGYSGTSGGGVYGGGGGGAASGGGGSDPLGMVQSGYGLANNASQLSGNGSLTSWLGGGSNGGGGGGFNSVFSGDGFLSKSSINDFGTNFGFSSGLQTATPVEAVDAAALGTPEVGLASEGLGSATGELVGMTLSEAIPLVGTAIGIITAFATGDTQGAMAMIAGAGIGFAVGGPIGAAVGAVLGSLVSSMFPSGMSRPAQDTNLSSTDTAADGITQRHIAAGGTDSFKMGGSNPTAQLAGQFAGRLNALSDRYSLAVQNVPWASASFGLYQGKSGNQWYSINPDRSQHYATADEAEAASEAFIINRHVIGTDMPGSRGVAIGHTLDNTAAKTFADLAAELDKAVAAADHFDAVLAASGHSMGQVAQQWQAVVDRFTTEAKAANQYGLPVDQLAQAFQGQINTSLADELLQRTDPTEFALEQQKRDADARLQVVEAFGADAAQAERLSAMERQDIITKANQNVIASYQQAAQAAGQLAASVQQTMQQLVMSLSLGAQSPLSPRDQTALALSQYQAVRTAALGGNTDAIQQFAGVAQTAYGAARNFWATGMPTVDLYNDILGVAGQLTQITSAAAGAAGASYQNAAAAGATTLLSTLPHFAGGTTSAPGGWAWVGERGPELVRLPGGSQVMTAQQSAAAAGGDATGAAIDRLAGVLAGALAGMRDVLQTHGAELARLGRLAAVR